MDGCFYLDQMACMRFRLRYLLLEVSKFFVTDLLWVFQGYVVVPENFARHFLGTHSNCSTVLPQFFLVEIYAPQQSVGDSGSVSMSMIYVSVSVANRFFHSSTAADHGYQSCVEFHVLFTVCCRQSRLASLLPHVAQREHYVTPNHSRFPAIDVADFLSGTRLMTVLNNFGS